MINTKPLSAALLGITGVLYLVASSGVVIDGDSAIGAIGVGLGVLFMLRMMDELGDMLNAE